MLRVMVFKKENQNTSFLISLLIISIVIISIILITTRVDHSLLPSAPRPGAERFAIICNFSGHTLCCKTTHSPSWHRDLRRKRAKAVLFCG